jgi:adenylate kinase family enzyme
VEVDLRRLLGQAPAGADRHGTAAGPVGRRIAVIGATGSGKTTVSGVLAERFGVPHVELDALFWNAGWTETPPIEFKQRVIAALGTDGWVVDGNYRGRLGTFVLDQADLVVWLDLPLRTTLWRVLRRTLRRLRTRELLWGTNVESWRGSFMSRDSLLWWALKAHFRWRQTPQRLARYPYVRLRSKREVERYVRLEL